MPPPPTKPATGPMPPAEFGQLVAYLTSLGFTGTQLAAAIGNAAGGRTRAQIADSLRAFLKTL